MTSGVQARRILVSLGLAAIAAAGAGCEHATGGDKGAGGGFQMPPALVTAATVQSASLPVYLDAIGRCTAFENVAVQAQATGTIVAIHFKDGADLEVGAPLLTIDPRPYQAQLDLAEANLAQSEAQLALGKSEFERMAKLLTSNAVSRQEHDARQNAVEVAQAQVKSSRAAVATAKINLDFCTIRSPIQGRAGQRLVDLGNVVVANGGTTLVTIQRHDPIYVDFSVSERDLASIRRSFAEKTLRAEAQVPGPDGAARDGAVTFLDNAVQDSTGTIRLRAQLENHDHVFWPGQFVNVRVVLRQRSDARVVPAAAIQVGQKGPYVYVIKADQGAELRPVVVGQRHGARVVVESGLELGEQVVETGQLMIFPGGKVAIAPPGDAK